MKKSKPVSVIIPTYNEASAVKSLAMRLIQALEAKTSQFELIFVDDYSTDKTIAHLRSLKDSRIKIHTKKGKKGKAFSISEGVSYAKGDYIVMIDGDLQYPPEEIPAMLAKLDEYDIVVANRKTFNERTLRKFTSFVFRSVFGKGLFGLNYDIQSGLKAFKKTVTDHITIHPSSGWTFDLEFLHRANQAGFSITHHDIEFAKRMHGTTKVSVAKTSYELALDTLKLRFKRIQPVHYTPDENSMISAGVGFRKKTYTTHTTLPHTESALETLILRQKVILITLLAALTVGIIHNFLLTIQVFVGVLSVIYFIDVLFNTFIVTKSLHHPQEIEVSGQEIKKLNDARLPVYSILCPLYKEAGVLPHFLKAIEQLDWPKSKLDVLLLLEADDTDTIEAAKSLNLPPYVRIIIIPDSKPKTKPKACNYGLGHAKGKYVVIYDAEDKPEALQLKKAYLAFKKAGPTVKCLQAKLTYYNIRQNILTRLFTAEYSLWFDVTLTGLQSLRTSLPLGGTSNHFRTEDLWKLQGWDPFNVTEDADLGIRLFKRGFKTGIIDSYTYEEANSKVGNWLRQRSRWIKGYMQTYLVHNRDAVKYFRRSFLHALIFNLTVGGKIAFILINPFLWIITILYFVFRNELGPTIEQFYQTPAFYLAVISLTLGNFMFMYLYMIGCAKRGHWDLMKYVFLIPVYWVLLSIAGLIAFYQLIFKPHYWEKTVHGLHLGLKTKPKSAPALLPSPVLSPGVPVVLQSTVSSITRVTQIKSFYIENRFILNGAIFSLAIVSLNVLNAVIFQSGEQNIDNLILSRVGLMLIAVYLLIAPFHMFGKLEKLKRVTHLLSVVALIFSSIQFVVLVETEAVSNLQFLTFVTIQVVCLIVLWLHLAIGNDEAVEAPLSKVKNTERKILIFNWRDTKHVWAGGAEIYIHEIAKRWLKEGNAVTLFTSNDRHSKSDEIVDGVEVVRRGGSYTVYVHALFHYLMHFRGKYDVIVDCENGIPFFTPLFVRKPIILLIHHVHQEVFRIHLSFPFSYIAQFLEMNCMPKIYRRCQIVTVSESSRADIKQMGFNSPFPIEIIYSGVVRTYLRKLKKTKTPSFSYIGRLKDYKNVDIAIRAFAKVLKRNPKAMFYIAGTGESRRKLSALVKSLNLSKNVIFTGRISEENKGELLARSWAMIQPSQVEGWGITVIESNACATPVIASNVTGLCDSVIDKKTGILVKSRDVDSFAFAMRQVIADTEYREFLSTQAYSWAKNFSWDVSSQQFLELIHKTLSKEKTQEFVVPQLTSQMAFEEVSN